VIEMTGIGLGGRRAAAMLVTSLTFVAQWKCCRLAKLCSYR